MQTVGVGLVAAMLVTPAATAYLLTRHLPAMMVLAACSSAWLASVIGLYASFYFNLASGRGGGLGAATIFFFVAYLFAPGQGLVWNQPRYPLAEPNTTDAAPQGVSAE